MCAWTMYDYVTTYAAAKKAWKIHALVSKPELFSVVYFICVNLYALSVLILQFVDLFSVALITYLLETCIGNPSILMTIPLET